MKKILGILGLVGAAVTLSACGERVEVPPASVGMVLGPNGFEGDIRPPSRFRLEPCIFQCDKLVVIEASDVGIIEGMQVLMPKDNLMLGVDIRLTVSLSQDQERILEVFDRVSPRRLHTGNFGTTLYTPETVDPESSRTSIYGVYGKSVVRSVARSVLSNYTIAEFTANQGMIADELRDAINQELGRTPLEVRQLGIAGIQYPDVVTQAMELRAEREIAIETAEAQAQVQIREAQARLEVAEATRQADLLEAETIAEANRILANGVTPELIEYRRLNVIQSLGENGNTIFFPLDLVGTEALNLRVLQSE